ncbi:MAG: amino acid adenylation domain-containing protein, partial [Actinomycetota bacterium]|nr:amino acid adenylation domain-containing protein [Actinomycetota bacterium]
MNDRQQNRLSDAQRELLAARLRKGRAPAAGGIARRPVGAPVPLSFAQEQLWFLDRFAPGLATYNIPHLLWLSGSLDQAALRRALDGLASRHESLRTRFVAGPGGQPVQLIDPPVDVPLPEHDLSALAADEAQQRVRELGAERARQPFDLAAGPLWRVELARLSATEHALVLVVHHSIFDAWSYGVLLRDLTALYDAEVAAAARPDALAVQFGDYAVWERQRLATPAPELLDYWRERLAGFQTLQLPTDRPRPVRESFAGGVEWLNLGTELLAGLRELSRACGTTPFVVLLAGLHSLLQRYTGQDDIVIGAPSANRGRAELAPLIGFLVNTLPIRADLSKDPTFGQLLDQVREVTVSAYAHQELPFARLVEALRVERDPGRTPVFQVALTFADTAEQVQATGLDLRLEKVDLLAAKYDLNFFAEVRADGLWVELSYASDLFDVETIRRMLGHYARLLAGAVADPAARLSELPLLSDAELHRELVEWNDTAAELGSGCLHERFEAQVRHTPDGIAATFSDPNGPTESVSYAELNAQANRIARRLVELGVRPERLVGVSMQPSIRRLAVLLAILKAGGGYVPLDPALPADRLAFMVADAELAVLVADAGSEPGLPALASTVLSLDAQWDSLQELDPANLDVAVRPADLAYAIYTSGSTGQPKGVLVEHRHAVNFAAGQIEYWQLGAGDRVLQFASLNFDVSVLDMFGALLSGATAVLAGRETLLSPPRLAALLREQRVSFGCLPPAVINLLTEQDFPNLRVLISAGEELRTELATSWLRPGLRLCNGYGPTETTVLSAFTEIDGSQLPPPIGLPPPNYQAYVLDSRLNPVPVGVLGELHTGGASVSRGYLNRPELTAERFVEDPFSDQPDARLYKTGDLVKRLPNGKIAFLGRIDGQVKIRGLRVELGEIETALAGHPAVAQAVVSMIVDRAGEQQLVGYLRVEPGVQPPDPAELKQYLSQWLPGYM